MNKSNYSKIFNLLLAIITASILFSPTFYQDSINIKTLFPNNNIYERIDSLNNFAKKQITNNTILSINICKSTIFLADSLNYKFGEINTRNILGMAFEKLGKKDSALYYYRTAYSLAHVKDVLSVPKNPNKKIDFEERTKALENVRDVALSLGNYYSNLYQFDSTLAYLKKSMSATAKLKDSVGVGNLLNLIGMIYWRKGDFNRSVRLYIVALSYRKKIGDKRLIVQSLNNLGAAYYKLGNYKLALDKYIEAINTRRKYIEKDSPIMLNSIGLIHLKLNDLEPAINYFNRALISAKELGSKLGIGYSHLNIGDYFFAKKKWDSALNNYKKGKKYYEEIGDINGVVQIINKIGEISYYKNNLVQAKKEFSKAYKISREKGLKLTEINALLNLARIDIKYGKNRAALNKLEEVQKLAANGYFYSLLLDILKLQIQIYGNLKEYKTALAYHNKYDSLKNKLDKESDLRIIADAKEKYRSGQKEAQNMQLRSENIAKDNQLKAKQRGIMYAIATAIFALFVIGYLIVRSYERSRRQRLILKSKTEIEKINQKLIEANKKLEESNATKDKFFSIIAHDLKNPFNTLLGATQIMKDEFRDMSPKDQDEIVDIIYNDTKKLYSLLENLLYWANSQRGNNQPKIVEINLYNAVTEIVNLYESSAQKKEITIEINIPQNINILFDKFMFSTIIRNLLSNAIKFTFKGGKIIFKAEEKGEEINLFIQDNGMGISFENIDKLFSATSDFKSIGTDNEIGTGLGLVLCKDFANHNNADISVNSTKNKGTTFRVTLKKSKS